jgi:hypothetical protein
MSTTLMRSCPGVSLQVALIVYWKGTMEGLPPEIQLLIIERLGALDIFHLQQVFIVFLLRTLIY